MRYTITQLRALIKASQRTKIVDGNTINRPVTPNDNLTIGRLAYELLKLRLKTKRTHTYACDMGNGVCRVAGCSKRIRKLWNCHRR